MPKDALPPVRATVEAKPLVTRPRPYKTKYCELYPMLEALPQTTCWCFTAAPGLRGRRTRT